MYDYELAVKGERGYLFLLVSMWTLPGKHSVRRCWEISMNIRYMYVYIHVNFQVLFACTK